MFFIWLNTLTFLGIMVHTSLNQQRVDAAVLSFGHKHADAHVRS